jgi:hypothetical protein
MKSTYETEIGNIQVKVSVGNQNIRYLNYLLTGHRDSYTWPTKYLQAAM